MTNNDLNMTVTVARLLFQERRLAYAITNIALQVQQVGGAAALFECADKSGVGVSIYDLVPELIGSEGEMAAIVAGKLPRFELSWLNRGADADHTTYLNLINLPHHDAEQRITGVVHLMEDSTLKGELGQRVVQQRNELRLLRDQLLHQNQSLASVNAELKRLDEMKSMFVSIAAHELRSPLASITGYVEMLLDGMFGVVPGKQTEILHIVESGVQRLLSISSNLLDATRLEAGRVELVLVPAHLSRLVRAVATEMMPQMEAREQQFTLDVAPDLPPVLCDRTRATQIIGNLLSNAVKYTGHHGRITVSLTLAAESGFVQMAVSDNGVGIPESDQGRIFNRFFRGENAHLTGETGAGLGLHITRGLVELHSGHIWLQSQLGQGSTFFVTFPIADEEPT